MATPPKTATDFYDWANGIINRSPSKTSPGAAQTLPLMFDGPRPGVPADLGFNLKNSQPQPAKQQSGGGGAGLAALLGGSYLAGGGEAAAALPEISSIPGVNSGMMSLLEGPTIASAEAQGLAPMASSSLLGPAAFIATAPAWTPLLANAGDKLAGAFGVGKIKPSRVYNQAEALQSKILPSQVSGYANFSDADKKAFLDKAHELGLLGLPGHADAEGKTQKGIGAEKLVFRLAPKRHDGSTMMSLGDSLKKENLPTLEKALAEVNRSAGYKQEYVDKINQLAGLAGNSNFRAMAQSAGVSPAPQPQSSGKSVPMQAQPSSPKNATRKRKRPVVEPAPSPVPQAPQAPTVDQIAQAFTNVFMGNQKPAITNPFLENPLFR